MSKYLDETGLSHLWSKVKALVSGHTATVTQTLTAGTEIGTVDGVALYAPSGGGGSQTTWYGTCGTAAGTAAKSVTCAGFTATTGCVLTVLFTAANTAATPTLTVNGVGPTAIYIGSATINATTNALKWSANTLLTFVFDGTYWRYISSQAGAAVQHPDGAGAWYGTGSVAAGTAAKTSAITNFRLTKGAMVVINHTTSNTAEAPTLNINSTGAKSIYYRGSAASATNPAYWPTNVLLTFIYSGSYWYLVDISGHKWREVAVTTSLSSSFDVQDIRCYANDAERLIYYHIYAENSGGTAVSVAANTNILYSTDSTVYPTNMENAPIARIAHGFRYSGSVLQDFPLRLTQQNATSKYWCLRSPAWAFSATCIHYEGTIPYERIGIA